MTSTPSVITAAQMVRIDGTVGNSVRAGASTVDVGARRAVRKRRSTERG
jgi:hypothetical protein